MRACETAEEQTHRRHQRKVEGSFAVCRKNVVFQIDNESPPLDVDAGTLRIEGDVPEDRSIAPPLHAATHQPKAVQRRMMAPRLLAQEHVRLFEIGAAIFGAPRIALTTQVAKVDDISDLMRLLSNELRAGAARDVVPLPRNAARRP